MWTTHEVANQVDALVDYNLFACDPALQNAVAAAGAAARMGELDAIGARLGHAEVLRLGDLANRHPPQLHTHDACGRRVDRVEYHPAWDALMRLLYADGVHCSAWTEPGPGAHVARAAAFFLHGQVEAGSLCPATMTFAAIPLLRREPALHAALAAQLGALDYDGRDLPAPSKRSVTVGMGLTEKQGGSDLRSVATQARRAAGGEYLLVGHKWFYSVPACDGHLVLARGDDGPACFFVPRWRPDGERNAVRIQRLKDKLGNRSNASGEVEFHDALGIPVGEPGRGIAVLIEMAAQTRLDCVLGSAALMRRALVEALHHARHRSAFGHPLIAQPLMRNVLADLALESEAATLLAIHLAACADAECAGGGTAARGRAWRRVLTPAAKFWICKRAIAFCAECMEVCGGNGYVEDGPMPRLLREAPVNSIWEGSGNVMCLDLLRALAREQDAAAALLADLADAVDGDRRWRAACEELAATLNAGRDDAWLARRGASRLVVLVQAALLRRHAPAAVAAAFAASRVYRHGDHGFGALQSADAAAPLLERAWPPA
ncbi:isovaleryl-CoA dehydrogenase [Azoarcus olearius]|uniref:Probable acyl-CoA dehydrogenase n=1 Tax=Azoarcus sp. (strain BH72) TaxID=418699 RepID=A1K7W1_AZOSB|nr:isovaleryl-CoA dehydrogenase [Azoarcus olearius]CAL94916.1 probable acyl-CoA dehydrogenase [Azoarcus olearius]